MLAKNMASRATSGVCVLALALLLASCKTPVKQRYTVGGSVSGLASTGLMLQNNGSGNLAISANGGFTFPATLAKGDAYNVTVRNQPSNQICAIANGAGIVSGNVTDVAVNCGGSAFTVGVKVSGLAGSGLVLQNNGGDDLSVAADGAFTFVTAVASGNAYSVTVLTQPAAPAQTCTVANGTGTVSADVTDIAVNCVTNSYTIGVTVSGLTGAGLTLQNNGGDNLSVSTDGAHVFATPVASGSTYSVTIFAQPLGQICSVANGSGSVADAAVTSVAVTCLMPPAAPTLSMGFGVKELRFSWPAVSGATFYRLLENPDGVSGYAQVGADITAFSVNLTIPVHKRLNASYIVQACSIAGCTDSAPQSPGGNLTQAIGYFKASLSTNRVNDQFGFVVAVSGDGDTLAVGAPFEDSDTVGIDTEPNESASNAGAVYVFTRNSGSWAQQAYVKASNAGAGDFFGNSLALSADGNTLAVGAPGEAGSISGINGTQNDNSAASAGAVYVYTRSGSTWSQQAYIKASNAGTIDSFGNSVALSADGNTLVAGAPFERSNATGIDGNQADNSAFMAGAAYVFTRSGSTWSQQAYVKASNTGASDQFGWSVALSGDGDTLAVGANQEDSALSGVTSGSVNEAASLNAASDSGAVYLYTRSAGAWSQQAYVKASNTGINDQFGISVALNGDGSALAVGAILEDSSSTGIGGAPDDSAADSGAVYSYARSGGTWSQQAYVKASNTGAGDRFGVSVALSGDGNTLAVGAHCEDSSSTGVSSQPNESTTDAGAVYLY